MSLVARGESGRTAAGLRSRAGVTVGITLLMAAGVVPVPADSPCADYPVNAATEDSIVRVADSLSECATFLSEAERERLATIIDRESHKQGYDPVFVSAIIQVESGCSGAARGPRGSLGLIQLQPETAREVAREERLPWRGAHSLSHPEVNVRLGLKYLAQLEERFNDPLVAVAAYNLGPGRVARMARGQARNTVYVRKVLSRYERLLARDALDWF
jgi:soluble lytic murein transglycosylase